MARLGPSKNTRPERMVREIVGDMGDHVLNDSSLPGSPDVLFPGAKVAIFVDGRAWHDPLFWRDRYDPKRHTTDWPKKCRMNRKRDGRVNRQLRRRGYTVIRIWDDCTTSRRALFNLTLVLRRWVRAGLAGKVKTTVRITRTRVYAS